MKRQPTTPVFDHEAANAPMPERVSRRKLIGGKYATVSTRKLAPGEKRVDPIERLLQIRDEILRVEAEAARAANAPAQEVPRQKAA